MERIGLRKGVSDMKLAGSFEAAVEVAEKNCSEWIFMGNGEVFHAEELHEVAKEYDSNMPLEEEDFLAVTKDGSIGLIFPGLKEPQWYFVSPEWAVVNMLHEDLHKYIIPIDRNRGNTGAAGGVAATGGAAAYCRQCGAPLRSGSRFCEHCGAKNAPEFCVNCGARLNPDSKFCTSCGTKV